MNYRHAYHAGNFCDVIKHIILTALITALTKKNKALCYLDTHAGKGIYDLTDASAFKTQEYRDGIEKIMLSAQPPPLVNIYLNCVREINKQFNPSHEDTLRYYPGSPLFAKQLLRTQDRLVLCELHAEEAHALSHFFSADKHIAVHHLDGFLGLKAFLPPKEHRGLVLIDPPYENTDEVTDIIKALPIALKRFATGVYAIWYPIKSQKLLIPFYQQLKQAVKAPTLITEITLYPDLPAHLNGCGMAIINPPWQVKETVEALLPWLWKALTINQQGRFSIYMES